MKETLLYKKLKQKKLRYQYRTSLRKKLKELYIDKGFSMEKISEMSKVSQTTVFNGLHEYNIPIRKFKYKKYNFSGDP